MKTINLGQKIIRLYDSIDEMPIVNFQKYNKFLLIDSGIGSDIDSIDTHISKIAKYIQHNDKKKALLELQNMRQGLYMINSEISPKYLAFAALIYKVNDKELTDLSDDSLKAILKEINAVKHSSLITTLVNLKKKVSSELELYFPGDFISVKEKEAYDRLKNRTLLILESIVTGKDNTKEVGVIDDTIILGSTPKIFIGSESVEIRADKQFESTCLIISQKTGLDAKKMTVLQFYSALENINKQAEAEMRKLKKVN